MINKNVHDQQSSSPEIIDFLNYKPHWVIRKANTFFLLLVILLIAITWFIRYPDIIKLPVAVILSDTLSLIISKGDAKEISINKIKIGQSVIIRAKDIQRNKIAVFQANIKSIKIPDKADSNWVIKLNLVNNKKYNKSSLLQNKLNATVEIKIDEKRLIEKVVSQLK